MEYTVDYFLEEIYQLEASGMLLDLLVSPSLSEHIITFEDQDRKKAINYIISVLDECYRGGNLKIIASHEGKKLYGYAMLFILPDPDSPKYLHKIYVKEKYRGNGIGKQILTSFLESEKKIKICLLCSKDNVPFYEISGFHLIKSFDAPKSGNFLLSNDLYLGLYLMSNYDEVSDAPIFLLNDTDIRKIVGI